MNAKKDVVAPNTNFQTTPIKAWTDADNKVRLSFDLKTLQNLDRIAGIGDTELFAQVFLSAVSAIAKISPSLEDAYNTILQTLYNGRAGDLVEARLHSQAGVLYTAGMHYLANMIEHNDLRPKEFYLNATTKLVRLHNETLETLNRYRRGGEQKVTVTHSVISGQTVINNFPREGVLEKNVGGSPCSGKSAEQKPEQIGINHADNQPCEMVDVDFMEEKPKVLPQKDV